MIKTVIFKLEGVVVNETLLYFKYYEILWYYLRKYSGWKSYRQLMDARDKLLHETGHKLPYISLARENLSEQEFENFRKEIEMFSRRNFRDYLRLVPGMRVILQTTGYYYWTAIYTGQRELLQQSVQKFRLDRYFPHYSLSFEKGEVPGIRDSITKILDKTRAAPEESVMISDKPASDLSAAAALGLYTIYADFDIRTSGVLPQGKKERLFFEKRPRKTVRQLGQFLQQPVYDAVARKPEEINKILSRLETGDTQINIEKQEEGPGFWDIMKGIFLPDFSE